MLSEGARLLLALLACYRLTRLLVYDIGPGEVLHKMRQRAGQSEVGKALACPYCTGVWVAFALALLLYPRQFWLVWWGLAGGQAAMQALVYPEQ